MRLLDERHIVALHRRPGRLVEGTVRVRGFDAMLGDRGVRIERRTAESIAIHHGEDVRRMAVPSGERKRQWLMMIAFPAAALALTRLAAHTGGRD